MALFNYPLLRFILDHLAGVLIRHFFWPAQQCLDLEQATMVFNDKALKMFFTFLTHIIESLIFIPTNRCKHHFCKSHRHLKKLKVKFFFVVPDQFSCACVLLILDMLSLLFSIHYTNIVITISDEMDIC